MERKITKGKIDDGDVEARASLGKTAVNSGRYGSQKIVDEEQVHEREYWVVYLVALFFFLATTAGLSCVVFLVFGASET